MQFQVPQNITMEDRIFGPLTTIQFVIVVIGGGIAFYMYSSLGLPSPINTILGGGMALLTVVVSVGKFNDQPIYKFFKYILAYIFTPKIRVWHKKGLEVPLIRPNPVGSIEQKVKVIKNVKHGDIEKLAKVLDSRGRDGALPIVKPITKTEVIPEVIPEVKSKS